MDSYEARRQANIKRNAALVQDLGLGLTDDNDNKNENNNHKTEVEGPTSKRRKLLVPAPPPTRTSRRLASAPSRPITYNEEALHRASVVAQQTGEESEPDTKPTKTKTKKKKNQKINQVDLPPFTSNSPPPTTRTSPADLDTLRAGWTSWTPAAPPPTRDETTGEYHFASHPLFRPNKSPEAILREGAFGGTYFRPLYSRYLDATIEDDWRELPAAWLAGVDVEKRLTSPTYDPAVNKYGVACGQSIEAWEAAGWIAHAHDVRGWFQWYCRFWMGRRCDDSGGGEDERQMARWRKCVGETGRWRRALLKKYVQMGVRSVFDEDGESGEVSPVVHQTCHHWAYEVRQEALDRFWAEGK